MIGGWYLGVLYDYHLNPVEIGERSLQFVSESIENIDFLLKFSK